MIQINDSCKTKRGCDTDSDNLPDDRKSKFVSGGMHEVGYDLSEILSAANISMDKVLEEERQG